MGFAIVTDNARAQEPVDNVQATPTPVPIQPRVQVAVVRGAEPQHTQPEIPLEPKRPEAVYAQRAIYSEAEWRELLAAAGWEGYRLEQAVWVSFCEGGGWLDGQRVWYADPPGYNDAGNARGTFQIWFRWHHERLVDLGYEANPDLLFNAFINARIARAIVERNGGWGAWTCRGVL